MAIGYYPHVSFHILAAASKYGRRIEGSVAVWPAAGHTNRKLAEVKHRSGPAPAPFTSPSVLAVGAPAQDIVAEVPHPNEKRASNSRYSLTGFTQVVMSEARSKNEDAETDYSH